MNVLVVDDYPDSAAATELLVAMDGHRCEVALSGNAALQIAESFEIDVAILDLGLPDISGFEVARRLRARAGKRPLHLAAVTGRSDATTRTRALRAGFDQHVSKPTDRFKISDILRTARARLGLQR